MPTFGSSIVPCRRWFRLLLVMVAVCLVPLASVHAAELGAVQKQQLDGALGILRQARTNYELAETTVDGGQSLSRVKVKLALVRLQSAEDSLEKAGTALEGLPAEHPDVNAATDATASIAEAIAKLKARLTAAGSGKPEPAADSPSAPNGTVTDTSSPRSDEPAKPLPARQRKQLEQIDLLLRTADVALDNLGPLVDQLLADTATPGSAIQDAGTAVMQTNAKLQEARKILEQLPLEHPQVAAMATAWEAELGRTQGLAKRLLPTWNAVQEVGGKANYPTYDDDLAMLAGVGDVYRDHELDLQVPERMAETLKNDPVVLAALRRVGTTYQPMIDQRTNEGNVMARQLSGAIGKRQAYLAAIKRYHPALVKRIEELLAETASLRTEAVKEQKPLYFAGGIQDSIRRAENWIAVLEAYAPDQAEAYAASLQAEREAVARAQVSLRETIITANGLPSDEYTGADRDELVELAIESWKQEQPDAKILAVRIPAQAWSRVTRWAGKTTGEAEVEGSEITVGVELTKYDNSKLQVQLIVAGETPRLAIIRPVNLWKNHQAGDAITASNFHELEDELQPHAYLLREKVQE